MFSLFGKGLNVRDGRKSGQCSPAGLEDTKRHAERATWPGTAGAPGRWCSRASNHGELTSANEATEEASAPANSLTSASWISEQRIQVGHAQTSDLQNYEVINGRRVGDSFVMWH